MKYYNNVLSIIFISYYLLKSISVMAETNIDCEYEDFKSGNQSYALTEEEKTQLLDNELIHALSNMDECIKSINKNKSSTASSSSSSSSSSSASRSSSGEDTNTTTNEQEIKSASINSQNIEDKNTKSKNAQAQESKQGGSISMDKTDSIANDDIVARQLREAAMAEEDEVIRELLWERYRNYKGQNNNGE
jgi:hypothetical protein